MENNVDVIVVGGGHAGCEAALASARLGCRTILFVLNIDSIAMMPCNPNIGGSSKGHLVREIDALGGEMGKNIDKTFLQSRMLNVGKGPAVHSLRAQADKMEYSRSMKWTLENTENLSIRQGEVCSLLLEEVQGESELLNESQDQPQNLASPAPSKRRKQVRGVVTESGEKYYCKAVVLALGTYLRARCLYGDTIITGGPNGLRASTMLYDCLVHEGIRLLRFKTGTPARIDRRSVDFTQMERQEGDDKITPFSFENTAESLTREQVPCYLTYTNEETHELIRKNLHRSPLYAGVIEGVGTRYCPSIEDKVVRFSDKERHQIFVEPEGLYTNELYVSGMSTSLPEDVQVAMYRTIPGLHNCRFTRTGYAIEYDCLDATELKISLEFKNFQGLFSAGQFNGSSGYEEAAAQGLIAGINAALLVQGKEPLLLDRSQAYIGVLIDDLVTKGTREPYRMLTSRSEYRLLLRQDNADMRLTALGYQAGLISKERYQRFQTKMTNIETEIKRVEGCIIAPSEVVNQFLSEKNSTPISTGIRLSELIKRPELSYQSLETLDPGRSKIVLNEAEKEEVNILIKYKGYIDRQLQQVEHFKKIERYSLPKDIDYNQFTGLRLEARQKLNAIKPDNIGQASRITGVSPADISVLLVSLKKLNMNDHG